MFTSFMSALRIKSGGSLTQVQQELFSKLYLAILWAHWLVSRKQWKKLTFPIEAIRSMQWAKIGAPSLHHVLLVHALITSVESDSAITLLYSSFAASVRPCFVASASTIDASAASIYLYIKSNWRANQKKDNYSRNYHKKQKHLTIDLSTFKMTTIRFR